MRNILNCKTNSSRKCVKCQKGSLLIESFAGEKQIQTPQQAVTTLLLSSSYCSVDQSDPNHLTNNREEGIKTIVLDEKIFHFLLPTHLFFISAPHSIGFAKRFQCSSILKSPDVFNGTRTQLYLAQILPYSYSSFPKSFFLLSHGHFVAIKTLLIRVFLPDLSTTEKYNEDYIKSMN